MADVDDIDGIGGWYNSALERLKGATEKKQELILQFLSRMANREQQ